MCLPACVVSTCAWLFPKVVISTVKTNCSCFGPALPSQNTVIGFTCSSHALCSEEHHVVLHPPFPKTSLLLLPISAP